MLSEMKMIGKKITANMLILLLVLSVIPTFGAQIPEVSAQMTKSPEQVDRKTDLKFTIDPDGWVKMKGAFKGVNMANYEQNFSLQGDFSLAESEAATNVTVLLPPEYASMFPFNATTLSFLTDYAEGLLHTGLNFTMIFPETPLGGMPDGEAAELLMSLFNSIDFTLTGEYSDGDLIGSMHFMMVQNLTDLLMSFLPEFTIGLKAPFIMDLNYSKGDYSGSIKISLAPGLPIADLNIGVEGDLTSVDLSGVISVIYGDYPTIGTVNEEMLEMIENYAETIFPASIDTEGSLLNRSQGSLQCPYISIQREDIVVEGDVIGSEVTFEIRISEAEPGAFLWLPIHMLSQLPLETLPSDLQLVWLYFALNETLNKIQDARLRLVYTPADTKLDFTITGTIHIRDIVEQLLEPMVLPEEWNPEEWGLPPVIDSTDLPCVWWAVSMLNATLYSIKNVSLHVVYTKDDRKFEVNFMSLVDVEGLDEALSGIELPPECRELLPEMPPEIPENLTRLIELLLAERFVNITASRLSVTYANGRLNYMEVVTFEGDVNAKVNYIKSLLIEYLNEMALEPAPWQVWYINDTRIDITGMKAWMRMDKDSMEMRMEGIAVKPPLDPINATAFKLYRFFNLTAGSPLEQELEQLGVTIIGGSNATHKVVLYNATGVPKPDLVLVDADNRPILMTWNNVTLSDLRDLQFIIVEGTQAGDVITEPETVTPKKPFILEMVGVMINMTRISDELALVFYREKAPVGVGAPPGTWKVLGNYLHVSVSKKPIEVNFNLRMSYDDAEVTAAGLGESSVRIFYWDTTLGSWVTAEPFHLNTAENHVSANFDHFSVFAVMADTPPAKVTLSTPTAEQITENSITLSWSTNQDPDFARYEVYQSSTSGVLGTLVTTITNRETTTYKVTNLSPDTAYYFTVRVYDTVDLYADSTQLSVSTKALPFYTQPWFLATVAGLAVVAIAVVVFLMRRKGPSRLAPPPPPLPPPPPPPKPEEDPLEVLKMRYARGEISKQEYEKLYKVIAGPSMPPVAALNKCPFCEFEIQPSDTFCPNCGKKLESRK